MSTSIERANAEWVRTRIAEGVDWPFYHGALAAVGAHGWITRSGTIGPMLGVWWTTPDDDDSTTWCLIFGDGWHGVWSDMSAMADAMRGQSRDVWRRRGETYLEPSTAPTPSEPLAP